MTSVLKKELDILSSLTFVFLILSQSFAVKAIIVYLSSVLLTWEGGKGGAETAQILQKPEPYKHLTSAA